MNLKVLTYAVVFGFLMSLIISCSKTEDAKTDDPFLETSGGSSQSESEDLSGLEGAGDPGTPSQELPMIFFPFDSAVLTADAISTLKEHAKYLKENPHLKIQIEGHCDERGTIEYNLALGERRAKAAREKLRKLGVASDRMSTISYGKERPLDPGHDESAWAKNRRAVFVILQE